MSTSIIPYPSQDLDVAIPQDMAIPLVDGLARFLRIHVAQGDASELTIKAYLAHIMQFVEWCTMEDIVPGQATEYDVANYRRALSAAGNARATIGAKLAAIRQFFAAAVWRGLRADNPAEGISPPPDHTSQFDRILERYLSPQQVQLLLASPSLDTVAGRRDIALLSLLYYHGLRISEAAKLTLPDLLDEGKFRILGKGKKTRINTLVPVTQDRLAAWLRDRQAISTKHSGDAIFLSLSRAQQGRQITTPGARWVVKRHLKSVGLWQPGLGPHALRHTHITHALIAGADLHAIAREVGHSSILTTTVYVHVAAAIQENPADAIVALEDL